jgi:MGT family glycosyltransferase
LRDRLFIGTALAYARDVMEELERFPADAVLTSEMLLGVMVGAEAAGVPCVALCSNVYLYPLPGVPPFGPGFHPRGGLFGFLRDAAVRKLAMSVFGKGTKTFNTARKELGLAPLRHPFDQIACVARALVLTSASFDFPSTALPKHVVYTGPELDDPNWTEPWQSPWNIEDKRPLVLVGFSTTFQNQVDVLRRVITALSTLDVRAVVTAGPSVDVASLPSPANVSVCRSAPHSRILDEASAVVTHAGHGTVIRSLAAGVPLICMPMGRDQNENTARVTARRAGVKVNPKASVEEIRNGIRTVLADPQYRQAAQKLGRRIVEDARSSPVVQILEEVADASVRSEAH